MRPETGVQCRGARKHDDKQQAPPEDRHGIAGQRGAHGQLVEPGATADRGEDAGGDTEDNGEDHGEDGELDRSREPHQEVLEHRVLVENEVPKSPLRMLAR